MMLWVVALLGTALGAPVETATSGKNDTDKWKTSLDRVTKAVVSIRMDRPRAFEGVGRGNSQATGFVIDLEQGLILTNRHVVTAGPTVAQAVFLNHEVVDLVPVYRDPVHDFGLFRFDPKALEFMKPEALVLKPEDANVGVQIRVVGNDSGERLSILDSTIARIDRAAPVYGGGYSDYDTFYIQAASATSGGSSGSPVVDIEGHVLALNAGSRTSTASAYYLPLERVARAVALVRKGEAVPRGTLQTRMAHTSYDELRRLGMAKVTEQNARARLPDATGLLMVEEVLAGGPADGKLRVGDVLVSINGSGVQDFVELETWFDDNVGKALALTLDRAGKPVEVDVTVDDLHALVPSRLLEFGGGVLHDLSIHQARQSQVKVAGVFVAEDGRALKNAGVGEGSVIYEADGKKVATLDELVQVLAGVPDGQPLRLRYFSLYRPSHTSESAVIVDRRWFPMRMCGRDEVGSWPCTDSAGPANPPQLRPAALDVGYPPVDDKRARAVQMSMVGIRGEVPFGVAGQSAASYTGGGLVVAPGLVVADRDTVPTVLGDYRLVIAGAFEVPAKVVALHDVHNLAVLSFDPKDLGSFVVTPIAMREGQAERGDKVVFVGLERDGNVTTEKLEVDRLEPFSLPAVGAPRFRETNLDVVAFRENPPGKNGAIVDKKGQLVAFWSSFAYNEGNQSRATWRGMPADVVGEMVALAQGAKHLRSLGLELSVVPLPRAIERGLPAMEAEKLVRHDPERRSVLEVARIVEGGPLAEAVRTGDLLVALDGRPVTRFREVELRVHSKEKVQLTVVRDGGLVQVQVATTPLEQVDVDRIVSWAGIRVHAPDRSAQLQGILPGHPYIAWLDSGSPAGRARLYAQRSVMSVGGVDTPNLDAFIEAVRTATGTTRVEVVTRTGEREVFAVEADLGFFPTETLEWTAAGWERHAIGE